MKQEIIFKINTQYKSIENFTFFFNLYKQEIYDNIINYLYLNNLDISFINLKPNDKNIIEISYCENPNIYKPLYIKINYSIDIPNNLIDILLQEIIKKYIIILRSKSDIDRIIKDYIIIKKENINLNKKLRPSYTGEKKKNIINKIRNKFT